jgi:hypothetical protein
MAYILGRVNGRGESLDKRALLLAFEVAGLTDNSYRSIMGVIAIALGIY